MTSLPTLSVPTKQRVDLAGLIAADVALRHRVAPWSLEGPLLVIATERPDDARLRDTLERLSSYPVRLRATPYEQIVRLQRERYALPAADLAGATIDARALALVGIDVAYAYDVLPLRVEAGALLLAMADPWNVEAYEAARRVARLPIARCSAGRDAIREAQRRAYRRSAVPSTTLEPIRAAVADMFETAVTMHASDIHVQPLPEGGRIRLRIDGTLGCERTIAVPYREFVGTILSDAGMESSSRAPMLGNHRLELPHRSVDLRIRSLATRRGPKLTIRLMSDHFTLRRLEDLGLPPETHERIRRVMRAPSGLILIVGPPRSGKTTFAYALLSDLAHDGNVQINTVENPSDIDVPSIDQTETSEQNSFERATEALLQADADVILYGELSDDAVAGAAIKMALSGSRTITTLHAPDAPRAIDRLEEMGVRRHAIGNALRAVVATRLLPRLCVLCRRPARVPPEMRSRFPELTSIFAAEPQGCGSCTAGFAGQIAVFELLVVTARIREAILRDSPSTELARIAAQSAGYVPLLAAAYQHVAAGTTTLAQVWSRVDIDDDTFAAPPGDGNR